LNSKQSYDVAIVGGGLAGLSLSILLGRKGYHVILFEKERFPYHKVCGEYISNESKQFLKDLGVPVDELPSINEVMITAPDGNSITSELPLGGFGISRYKLDKQLSDIARESGVEVREAVKVNDVQYNKGSFAVSWQDENETGMVQAGFCCGAYGKKSNLDIKWERSFLNTQNKKLDNYVGVKYHIETDWTAGMIGLHNFNGGYAGISRVEDGKYCFCYMTKAIDIKTNGGDIASFEKNVLSKNPFLHTILTTSRFLPGFPVTIAQINFQQKSQVENNVLLLGDAAGMIAPLCGNGMSMALHSGKMAAAEIGQFLQGRIDLSTALANYSSNWKKQFSSRLKIGRLFQGFFGKETTSNRFVQLMRLLPFLRKPLIRLTHGKPF
jgi:menaquinone-9 beta-reductase